MHFKFVDIGTSDFDTQLSKRTVDDKILLVEPLFYYLRNLPDGEGIFKANFAVSDANGFGKMFYVKTETIKEHGMPSWVRGCNSLNTKHPTVLRILKELQKSEDLISQEEVRILSFQKLVELYEVTSIDILKIDTEGHDAVILGNVYQAIQAGFQIKEIQFEYIPEFAGVKDPLSCCKALDAQLILFRTLGFTKQVFAGCGYNLTRGPKTAQMFMTGAVVVPS